MTNSSTERDLLRGALIPSLVVGVIAIIISTITQGNPGFMGALLAQLVVVMFFAVHIGVSKISRNLDPMSTMALALFSYFAKFILLGAFLYVLTRMTSRESIDRGAFGITAITLTFTWLGGEIRSYLKLKLHLPLPTKKE
jgi:FtsH-binding integral membrane protein